MSSETLSLEQFAEIVHQKAIDAGVSHLADSDKRDILNFLEAHKNESHDLKIWQDYVKEIARLQDNDGIAYFGDLFDRASGQGPSPDRTAARDSIVRSRPENKL